MVYNKHSLNYCKTLFIKSYKDRLLYEGLQCVMSHHINIHRRWVLYVINGEDGHTMHCLLKRKGLYYMNKID